MIKHLGGELVPFEDCGFARYPEMPCAGEEVTVRCRVDDNDALPVLALTAGEGARPVRPVPEKPGFYAFPLGAFAEPQQLSYRITAGGETTPAFTFDVVEKEIITVCARAWQFDKRGIRMALAPDLTLTVKAGEKLEISLEQGVSQQEAHSCNQAGTDNNALTLPGEYSFSCDPAGLWVIYQGGQAVCRALHYEPPYPGHGRALRRGGPV